MGFLVSLIKAFKMNSNGSSRTVLLEIKKKSHVRQAINGSSCLEKAGEKGKAT